MAQGFARQSEQSKIRAKQTLQEWVSFFETLEDPRGKQGREHDFLSIVMIAILAVIAGAKGWDDIELYAESHQRWLEDYILSLKANHPTLLNSVKQCFDRIQSSLQNEIEFEFESSYQSQIEASHHRLEKKSLLGFVRSQNPRTLQTRAMEWTQNSGCLTHLLEQG